MFELFPLAALMLVAALLAWSGLHAWRTRNGRSQWSLSFPPLRPARQPVRPGPLGRPSNAGTRQPTLSAYFRSGIRAFPCRRTS